MQARSARCRAPDTQCICYSFRNGSVCIQELIWVSAVYLRLVADSYLQVLPDEQVLLLLLFIKGQRPTGRGWGAFSCSAQSSAGQPCAVRVQTRQSSRARPRRARGQKGGCRAHGAGVNLMCKTCNCRAGISKPARQKQVTGCGAPCSAMTSPDVFPR